MRPANDDAERSLGSLFGDLSRETSTLFRKEIELARAEIADKVSRATPGAVGVAVGGLVLFISLQALVATLILILGVFMAWWLAALIVTVLVAAAGAAAVAFGMRRLRTQELKPTMTVYSLKRTATWAKGQLP